MSDRQCKSCGAKLYYGSIGYETGFCHECAWKYATDQPLPVPIPVCQGCAERDATIKRLTAEADTAFAKGIESVLRIRCYEHAEVPQYNESEHGGGECGACAVIACVAQTTSDLREDLAAAEERIVALEQWISDETNGKAAILHPLKRPTRWHDEMRQWQESIKKYPAKLGEMMTFTEPLCWAYINEKDVCIRSRGHDDGAHEPLSTLRESNA